MRRNLLQLAAVFILCAIGASAQTCSNTQVGSSGFTCIDNGTNWGNATSMTVTFAGGYGSGVTIVVGISSDSTAAYTSGDISNTAGYSWNFWGNCADANNQQLAVYYYTTSATNSSSDTITVTNAAGSYTFMDVAVYSGVGAIDGAGTCGTAATGTAIASGNYSVTTGDLNVGFDLAANPSGTDNAGSGWNKREQDTLGPFTAFEDQVAASGTADATFTQGATGYWIAIGIAFKPASSPPSCAPTLTLMGVGRCG